MCFATSGPGATNLVTGIATAYMDSVPMVAITCNVNVPLLGKDSFQEIDIAGITMPITKHNFIVKDVNNLADTIRRAFRIAKKEDRVLFLWIFQRMSLLTGQNITHSVLNRYCV